jgi:hypothetical protein
MDGVNELLIFNKRFWQLYQTMSDSVVEAFRFKHPILSGLIRILFSPFVFSMARVAFNLDKIIDRDGHLQGVCTALMDILVQETHVHNASVIPSTKPILFVGNHAGMGDSLSLLMSSSRTDIHTLVFNRGMLKGLPEFLRYAIIVDESRPTQALRESVRHLKQGKSILMFPRGQMEDDPALYLESAIESLDEWSPSIEFFVKHVPDLQVIPFAVGGVIPRNALNNTIIKRYKDRNNRHFLAATFQLMFQYYRDPIVSIFYGDILADESATLENVQVQMQYLLKEVQTEQAQLIANGSGCKYQ